MIDLELRLPDEVMENIPSGNTEEIVRYLARYFDTVIEKYNDRFQKRMRGPLGEPLSKYEKAIIKDFLIDQTLGRIEEGTPMAAETLTNS